MIAFGTALVFLALGQKEIIKPSSYTETIKTVENLEVLIKKAETKPGISSVLPLGTEKGDKKDDGKKRKTK